MGLAIDRDRFDPVDYHRFEERLEECLLALFLIDGRARALPRNQEVRADAADPRVVLEIDRFNLELNLTPAPLAGRPFSAFGAEVDEALAVVRRAAAAHDGRVVMTGILPTLRPEDLGLAALSDARRFRALNNGIRRLRQEPSRVRIDGADPWSWPWTTSCWRAPTLLPGPPARRPRTVRRRLQRRAARHRSRAGGGGQLPHLPRAPAVGGDAGRVVQAGGRRPRRGRQGQPARLPGGLRHRVGPGGCGGAAGAERAALALAPDAGAWTRRLPFQQVHHNFYRAAQLGPGASLAWPLDPGWRVRALPVAELARRLLPTARQGLQQAGVAGEEIDGLLGVIEARVTVAQTGAAWQRRTLAALEPRLGRERALAAMLERYLEHQTAGDPVHTWPVEARG